MEMLLSWYCGILFGYVVFGENVCSCLVGVCLVFVDELRSWVCFGLCFVVAVYGGGSEGKYD